MNRSRDTNILIGLAALIVGLFAWLAPFDPIGRSPFSPPSSEPATSSANTIQRDTAATAPPQIVMVTVTSFPNPTPTSIPASVLPQVVIVTATSIPTPSCPVPNFFENVWRSHSQLGCPTNSMTSDFTFQYYERGIMAWQKSPSPSTIYAFFNDGRWEQQTNPGGPETPPCREAQIIGRPIRGFGTLWCNNQSWRERLGVPTSDENDGKNNQIQIFQNGTVFTVGTAGGFILYTNSRWERF